MATLDLTPYEILIIGTVLAEAAARPNDPSTDPMAGPLISASEKVITYTRKAMNTDENFREAVMRVMTCKPGDQF